MRIWIIGLTLAAATTCRRHRHGDHAGTTGHHDGPYSLNSLSLRVPR